MDSQSSIKPYYTTEVGVSEEGARDTVLRRLSLYAFCALLGLLGGAIGVTLAVGLAVLIQVLLPPPAVFAPGAIPLMLVAITFGLGFSWLLGRVSNLSWSADTDPNVMRVMVIFSVLAGLLQSLLFFGLV
jgi:ABC-type antimicrobial peptide transport system permease subunit